MNLSLKTFSALVQDAAAAVQSSASQLLNLTPGSVLRAILEASASGSLWLQWIALQILRTTRAATSAGSDLDTWMADFSLTRLPAVAATGGVTFSRFSNSISALIPVGAQVKSSDGSRLFEVVADSTNAAWNGSSGFTLAAGTASVTCTVQDITADANGNLAVGAAGNVLANTLTLLATAIPGVDTVTNTMAFTNGVDAESDAALRARFTNYINTRSRATEGAVGYAVQSLQQGLTYTVAENQVANGTYTPGTFVVSIDDGSGATPGDTVSLVATAVNAVRPIGSTAVVQAASKVAANVNLTITVASGAVKANLIGPVATAITNYINALPVGAPLSYLRLAQVAYDASASITGVSAMTLNGGTSDLTATQSQAIRAGTITVS